MVNFLKKNSTQEKSTSILISACLHLVVIVVCGGILVSGRQGLSIFLDGQLSETIDYHDFSFAITLPDDDPIESEEWSSLEETKIESEAPTSVINEFVDVDFWHDQSLDSVDLANFPLLKPGGESSGASSKGSAFFGIPPTGDRIVYIIDRSPSMSAGKYQRRYDRAVDEVMRSINELRYDQEFFVIMFSFTTLPLKIGTNPDFVYATGENKQILEDRLRSIRLSSGTDPREAIVLALNLNPSCIFLLSDGAFNGRQYRNGIYGDRIDAFQLSVMHNKNECRINTIGLEDAGAQAILTRIAEASGGEYVFIPAE